MEDQTDHFLNPFSYPPSEPFCPPVKTEFTSGTPLNPIAPSPSYPQQVHYAPNPSEVALQEIVKLQVKQTELSSLIAEQQRISSLPVQEPPTFGGSFFDYPIFMGAFETIIEGRVSADKERTSTQQERQMMSLKVLSLSVQMTATSGPRSSLQKDLETLIVFQMPTRYA